MKEIVLGKGVAVSTPWLSIVEAAAYCNMSRERFLRQAGTNGTPHGGGTGTDRSYHVANLDRLMRQTGYNPPAIETGEEDQP